MLLENANSDIVGLSEGVVLYLGKDKEPLKLSKLDVEPELAKVDTSINPLGGKEL